MSFQNKNKKEFENVYYKNKFNVYRIAMDYSGSHKESAEEIFQEVFLKLYTHFDTVDEEYIHRLDRPNGKYSVKKIIEKMKEFKGNCIIQTMFLKGSYLGKDMDNTSDKFVLPWLEAVKEIAPRQVMIYTIDRETPDHDLQKATHEELDRIVELIKKAGIPATASY